MNKHWL